MRNDKVRSFDLSSRAVAGTSRVVTDAIANEAGVSAREIEERFSLVEVSDTIAEDAIRALRATSLRGQRVTVRRDQPKRSTK